MTPDDQIEQTLKERAAEGRLLTLRMDIINKCNLQCVMCHYSDPDISRRKAVKIDVEEFDVWFSGVGPYVRELMLSCGDEPLMSPHFTEILTKASQFSNSMDIGLCSNAMLLTSKIRSAILEHGVSFIIFSIDGAQKETVERIRAKSDFDRIIANIKALRDLKKATSNLFPRFTLNLVMMRSNIHEGPAFVEMAHDLGAEAIDLRHGVPSSYWDDPEEKLENFPAEFNYYRNRIVAKARELGLPIFIPDPYPGVAPHVDEDLSAQVDLAHYYAIEPDAGPEYLPLPKIFANGFLPQIPLNPEEEFFGEAYCDRPFSEVLIRNQREVLPCAWHKKVMGELGGSETVEDIFFGENFAALRAKMMHGEIDEGCVGCPIKTGHLPTRLEPNSDD